MKKLGLIGGVGPESTLQYYKEIIYGVQKKLNKPYFPPLVIESLSSFEVMRLSSLGKFVELKQYLLKGIENLANASAEIGAISCNTGHCVFKDLQKDSPIPLISIVDVTCQKAIQKNYQKVGLLGTATTMKLDFFKEPFLKNNIKVFAPNLADQKFIDNKISQELEFGIINEDTVQKFVKITNNMINENGIEALILGCTELPLIFDTKKISIPYLNTVELHINAIMERIMED